MRVLFYRYLPDAPRTLRVLSTVAKGTWVEQGHLVISIVEKNFLLLRTTSCCNRIGYRM
jgi:hypothetical protein